MGIKMSLALHLILTLGKWYKSQTFDLVYSVRRHSAFLLCFFLTAATPRKADVFQPSRNTVLVVTCSYIDPHPLCHPIAYLTTVPAWAGLTWTGDPCTKHRVPTGASHSVSVVGSVGLQPAELLGDCSPETAKSCQLVGALKGAPGRQQQQKCISIQTAWSATSC